MLAPMVSKFQAPGLTCCRGQRFQLTCAHVSGLKSACQGAWHGGCKTQVKLLRMCLASCWVPWQSTAAAHSNAPGWCAAGGLVGLARPVSSSRRHMMAPCACWIRRRGALSCSLLMRMQSILPWIACQVSVPLFPAVADHVSSMLAAVCRACLPASSKGEEIAPAVGGSWLCGGPVVEGSKQATTSELCHSDCPTCPRCDISLCPCRWQLWHSGGQ